MPRGTNRVEVQVQLFAENGQSLGVVNFMRNNSNLPNNRVYDNWNPPRIMGFLHREDYSDVIDLLRNEKPVWVHVGSTTSMWVGTVKDEPIGESDWDADH
jgi:hypothetical protein